MTVEFISGKVLEGTVITKALNVLVLKGDDGRYHLISRYSLKNPDKFKFPK